MKLDVRCKIVLFIVVSITSFMAKDIVYGSIVFAIVCLLICSMGQKKTGIKYIAVYAFVVAFIEATAFMPAVLRSLVLMTTLCIRMFLPVLLYAKAFEATTTVSEMITGMFAMRLPRSLVITFAVTIRFFPTAKEEMRNINDAMRLRGMGLSFGNLVRYPNFLLEGFFTPMMMRASTISEELSASAITRGLDSPAPRTAFYKLRLTFIDIIITLLFAIALCAAVVVKQLLEGGAA